VYILPVMAKSEPPDPAMVRVQEWIEENKPTLNELGLKMGFDAATARQAVHQFLKGKDPRIKTLRRFAEASGIDIAELVTVPKPTARPKR